MAEMNNFSDITENFNTIKTLLNSIRAQGILNTSDVDKLLSGINTKLEKIDTEEDIELIKGFLSDLKNNLDERHNVLLSKFGAIESLFATVLKNSAETLKSSEIKELFDIVATNLSVFSREVVSQKETLTDITLRLDTMRSDDSQKRDIIKNISVLKADLDKLSNGFDSIVLSLNENFKVLIKTLSSIDQSEAIVQFGKELNDILNSSNTVLSAIQMLDKKSLQIEDAMRNLATQDDISAAKQWISDLVTKNHELTVSIENLAEKYYKIDNLAEKIDASVNIIAGLKSAITDSNDDNTQSILTQLNNLEVLAQEIYTNQGKGFEQFKNSLEVVLKEVFESAIDLSDVKDIILNINKVKLEVNEHADAVSEKLAQLVEVSITRTINDISSNTDIISSRIKESVHAISSLCEKSFGDVSEDIANLKTVVAQVDENNTSANNAIFSNITDRLAIFENSLKSSLEKQETSVANSANKLIEQICDIKNLSGGIDYKLDSSSIELNNAKREFSELKSAVEDVLALDFVNVVKDLRVDLYASKEALSGAIETSTTDASDKLANDLFGKYELLISKLDNVEDEIKKVQLSSLNALKTSLESIASSIVDVLSYVSVSSETNNGNIDSKINELTEVINDCTLNYVENVRDIVETVNTKVENNLTQFEQETARKIGDINSAISKNTADLKEEIKYSYEKLLEVQGDFDSLKEVINSNNLKLTNNIDNVISSADSLKSGFDAHLTVLKNSLIDRISEFKQDFTCENADKFSEIKLQVADIVQGFEGLSDAISAVSTNSAASITSMMAKNLENFVALKNTISALNDKSAENLKQNVEVIINDFALLRERLDSVDASIDEDMSRQLALIESNFERLTQRISDLYAEGTDSLEDKLNSGLSVISERMGVSVTESLTGYKNQIEKLFSNVIGKNDEQAEFIKSKVQELSNILRSALEVQGNTSAAQLQEIAAGLKAVLDENHSVTLADYEAFRVKLSEFATSIENNNSVLVSEIKAQLDDITKFIDTGLDIQAKEVNVKFEDVARKVQTVSGELSVLNNQLNNKIDDVLTNFTAKSDELMSSIVLTSADIKGDVKTSLASDIQEFNDLLQNKLSEIKLSNGTSVQDIISLINDKSKDILSFIQNSVASEETRANEQTKSVLEELENIKLSAGVNAQDTSRIISEQSSEIASLVEKSSVSELEALKEYTKLMLNEFKSVKTSADTNIQDTIKLINEKSSEIRAIMESSSVSGQIGVKEQAKLVLDELENIKVNAEEQVVTLQQSIVKEVLPAMENLYEKVQVILEEHSLNFVTQLANTNVRISEDLTNRTNEFFAAFKALNERLDKDEVSQINLFQAQLEELSKTFNVLIDESKNVTKSEVSAISQTLIQNSKALMDEVEQSIDGKINTLLATSAEISADELKTIEAFSNKIIEQVGNVKQNSMICKDLINEFIKKELDIVTGNIEKETDVIVSDLIEQFELFRDSQKDELSKLSVHIESSIEDYIYNYLNDLKGYLDLKTDNSIVNHKLDNLRSELDRSCEEILNNVQKMIDANVASKEAYEILIVSMTEKVNNEIRAFITENVSKNFDEKLSLFDKNIVDTIVNKYNEVREISQQYNNSFDVIKVSIEDLTTNFIETKNEINDSILSLFEGINNSIGELSGAFEDLKSKIVNKDFEEAFQTSLNNQIAGIEKLVNEQLGYLEDISDLCCQNLPELTEMNTIVKYGIQESLADLTSRVENSDVKIEQELNNLKSDVITQFLNIFNQISFVAEQEEILDFIQKKHSELITILSHIVTTVDGVEAVKDNLAVVDSKMDSLREDIDLINEKITSIISSDGDIDYVYSLQDLESDIANLRLVLNEMKQDNKSKELEELITSTNDIYKIMESIKLEMPKFEIEEFKRDFESLSEDIVSISTRTNKLILASDESYKTLQDNLHDFKLVINDLDERTRNFAHESGIDRLDNKLGSINAMIQSGAKTNQVFNQVFEYLAEWVDKAGAQINTISDKVETLDDIGQIKVMLEDLRAEASDNTESMELIDALSNVFDKQAKRISSLEAKLDRVIVETTISNKNNKLDMTPFEDTLNRFLVAIDDRMHSQQVKIASLETKLEEVMSLIDPKDTAQLTKKVGGMDRQIAKLNKSIEKIASHVVEK